MAGQPQLLSGDEDAEYAAVIEIDLNDIKEPLLACPNDPDDVKTLSDVANTKIDEVFIGSCMTNIGHYRAAGKLLDKVSGIPTRLWIAPPTRMDEHQLMEEATTSTVALAHVPKCQAAHSAWVTKHVLHQTARWYPLPRETSLPSWSRANVYLSSARASW